MNIVDNITDEFVTFTYIKIIIYFKCRQLAEM